MQKVSKLIMIAGVTLSLGGCDFLYRLLDKEGGQEQALIGKILPFESNAMVLEAQTLLKLYGYSIGTPDGILGGQTRDVIEKFQEDNSIKPSRFIDDETWAQLHIFDDTGLVIDGQLSVQAVQIILKTAGFDPGSADGVMGPRTQEAVKSFQAAHHLPADGKIGYQTLKALASYTESAAEE